jgi:hypothetical protein
MIKVLKAYVTHVIFAHNIEIKYKKILRYLRHRFQCPIKVSSEKTDLDLFLVYIASFFVKSLLWPTDHPWPKNIFLSQYCVQKNIV